MRVKENLDTNNTDDDNRNRTQKKHMKEHTKPTQQDQRQ